MSFCTCRFYRQEYPQVGDVVHGIITKANYTTGLYVKLKEYDMIEAFVSMGEVKKAQYKNKKSIGVGKSMFFVVTTVDLEKKYIDMSLKRIHQLDEDKKTAGFFYTEKMHQLGYELFLFYRAYTTNEDLNEKTAKDSDKKLLEFVMDKTIWNYLEKNKTKTPEDQYKSMALKPKLLFVDSGFDDEFIDYVISSIQNRIRKSPFKLESYFDLKCTNSKGLHSLDVLNKVLSHEMPDVDFKIEIISPPKYRILVVDLELSKATKNIKTILSALLTNAEYYNAIFSSNEDFAQIKKYELNIEPYSQSEIDFLIKKSESEDDLDLNLELKLEDEILV
jgi:translation initiation factor 2 alpha subunit (eIF-2alpha)